VPLREKPSISFGVAVLQARFVYADSYTAVGNCLHCRVNSRRQEVSATAASIKRELPGTEIPTIVPFLVLRARALQRSFSREYVIHSRGVGRSAPRLQKNTLRMVGQGGTRQVYGR